MEDKNTYIDLGLKSGTLWATENQTVDGSALVTYYDALRAYGNNIPKIEDFWELFECKQRYDPGRKGTIYTGPNGNELFFPADEMNAFGYTSYDEERNTPVGPVYVPVKDHARYWSRTPLDNRDLHRYCLIVQESLNGCAFPYYTKNLFHVRICKRGNLKNK